MEFAKRMMLFVRDADLKETLGNDGHSRVVENFSFDAFTSNLDRMVSVYFYSTINGLFQNYFLSLVWWLSFFSKLKLFIRVEFVDLLDIQYIFFILLSQIRFSRNCP